MNTVIVGPWQNPNHNCPKYASIFLRRTFILPTEHNTLNAVNIFSRDKACFWCVRNIFDSGKLDPAYSFFGWSEYVKANDIEDAKNQSDKFAKSLGYKLLDQKFSILL